jgi:hypothetical protein
MGDDRVLRACAAILDDALHRPDSITQTVTHARPTPVDHGRAQVCGSSVGIPEPAPMRVHGDECVLDGVFGMRPVSDQAVGEPQEVGVVPPEQDVDSLVAAWRFVS